MYSYVRVNRKRIFIKPPRPHQPNIRLHTLACLEDNVILIICNSGRENYCSNASNSRHKFNKQFKY